MARIGMVYPEAEETLARRVSALITQKIPGAEIIHIAYEDNLANASMTFVVLVVIFSPGTSPVQMQTVLDFVDRANASFFAIRTSANIPVPSTAIAIESDALFTQPGSVFGRMRARRALEQTSEWLNELSRAVRVQLGQGQAAIPPLRGGIPAGYGQQEEEAKAAETADRKRDEGISRAIPPPPFQAEAPPKPITPTPAFPPEESASTSSPQAGEGSYEPSDADEFRGGGSGGVDPVLFSAYAPREVKPMDWQAMKVYAFRETAAGQVETDAKATLGARFADYRPTAGTSAIPIEEGTLITATPDVPGVQFNPPSAQVAFFEEWHRLDFKLRANTAPLQQAANGRITFSVEGVIAAELPLSVFVTEQPTQIAPVLHAAKPYRAVFCSYSHADTPIVERVERAIRTLGYDYLRDVKTLRSGEDWNAGLMAMIDRADIFQLFWSDKAAASKYVRQEWEYALARAVREGIPSFIRPVYWQKPMPGVPPELGHIHFAPDETLDDEVTGGGG